MITTNYVSRGQIWLMRDKTPTKDVISHNYIIISKITDKTEQVLCLGITSNTKIGGLIPIMCTNGQKSFINPKRVYSFYIKEFVNRNVSYHGNINDDSFMDDLIDIYCLSQGLPTKKSADEIEKIYKELQKNNVKSDEERNIDDSKNKLSIPHDDKDLSIPADEVQLVTSIPKTDNIKYKYKKLKNWDYRELKEFIKAYELRNYEKCKSMTGSSNMKYLYNKKIAIMKELKRRDNQMSYYNKNM